MEKCRWQNVNDNIETRWNKFTMFSYILSCKIRPRLLAWRIQRNIFYSGYEKKKLKKKLKKHTRKDFDQGTVVIQTPSFTTSKDFKISEILLRSQIGYPLHPYWQVCWAHRAFAAKDCAQHVCKGVSVTSGLHKSHGVARQRQFWLNLSFFRKRELMDLISSIKLRPYLYFSKSLVTISFFACLVKAPVHLPIGRVIRPLKMEGKSVLQLLFWNRFHVITIAETKLAHKEETFLNFCKEFFLDVLQLIQFT